MVGVIRYVLAVFCVFSPSALWFDSVPSRLNLLGVRGNLKRKVENNPRKVVQIKKNKKHHCVNKGSGVDSRYFELGKSLL